MGTETIEDGMEMSSINKFEKVDNWLVRTNEMFREFYCSRIWQGVLYFNSLIMGLVVLTRWIGGEGEIQYAVTAWFAFLFWAQDVGRLREERETTKEIVSNVTNIYNLDKDAEW